MFTLWFFVVQRASPAVIRLDPLEFSHISLSRPPLTPLGPPCCTDRYIFKLVYTCAHSHKTLGRPEQIDGDNELGQCELVRLSRLLWGKFTQKWKFYHFLTFISNLYDLLSFLLHCFGPHWISLYGQKHKHFVFHRRKSYRFGTTWQNVHVFAKQIKSHWAVKWWVISTDEVTYDFNTDLKHILNLP